MGVTLKFQSSGRIPGDGRPVVMQGGSITVGRGPANDLVLPDPDRTLSKSHFVIEDHNGNVMIVDLSTNGTFLNYSKIPLGRTPTPLNSGDVLSVGGYEIVVEITAGQDRSGVIADPLAQDDISHGQAGNAPDPYALLDDAGPEGDFLDDLLGGGAVPKGPGQIDIPDPIDELLPPSEDPIFGEDSPPPPADDSRLLHGGAMGDSFRPSGGGGGGANIIPDDWDDDFLNPEPPAAKPAAKPSAAEADPFATQATPAPRAEPAPAPAPPPEPPADEATQVPGAPRPAAAPAPQAPPPPAAATGGDTGPARAFLDALELEDFHIADADLPDVMARTGRVLKAMITGLREVLMTRTSIKSEFRIDQTMIAAKGNNPLKFSLSADQAVEALVRPRAKGYLGAEEATAEALDDIKAHEVAMVTGMEAALKGVLARLDPAELSGKIEQKGGISGLFKGKKAQYWEIYEKMYAEISDQAENDFQELFAKEFARAYKEQLGKLKQDG